MREILNLLEIKKKKDNNIDININYNNQKYANNADNVDNADITNNADNSNSKIIQLSNLNNGFNDNLQSKNKTKKLNSYQTILAKKNEKSMILNKDMNKLIDFKKRKRTKVVIGSCERMKYVSCFYANKLFKNNTGFILMLAAEKDFKQRTEIFETWKLLDQFKLFLKLFLNEHQCFMIENRGKKLLTNDFYSSLDKEKFTKLMEEEHEAKINMLANYINSKKETNSLVDVDVLLFSYLSDELQNKINN